MGVTVGSMLSPLLVKASGAALAKRKMFDTSQVYLFFLITKKPAVISVMSAYWVNLAHV